VRKALGLTKLSIPPITMKGAGTLLLGENNTRIRIEKWERTGSPISRISPISRNRPSTTTPATPSACALAAIKPPKHAEGRLAGWEMNMIWSFSLESAKWPGGVGEVVSWAGTIWLKGFVSKHCFYGYLVTDMEGI